MADNNDPKIREEIERIKKATGLQEKDDVLFSKVEKGLFKVADISTDDMMSILKDACGEDAPDLEELKKKLSE